MTTEAATFGARFVAASPADRAALHLAEGDRGSFSDYDRVLGDLFVRAIRGAQLFELTEAPRRTESDVITLKVGEAERSVLAGVLAIEAQQERGAWYVPEADKPMVGMVEFARWADAEPRFSISAADTERAAVRLDTPDAIVVWAALEPVMKLLYLPLKLRSGYWLGDRRPDQMEKDWAKVDAAYATLGIDTAALSTFKNGREWATLTIDQVIAARQALLTAWKSAPRDVGDRAIALLISTLVERYYAKARNGLAQRTKVMNKDSERTLTGAFGGDWLAFVRYLGERVHPAEQIATAVEPTSLLVSGRERTALAAASTGVPAAEIERVLSAYWGGETDSPVERRAGVIRDWWQAFDALHACQAPGMPSLWGLLDGERFEDTAQNADDDPYNPRAYRLLPANINARVEALWGTAMLPRWPQALVTEPYPQASFAETLGPGIDFWHGVALTCWFVCEGPYSRTDISGMANYYERQIKELDNLGCPIDHAMFADLRKAEKKLTDRPQSRDDTIEQDIGDGLSISITVGTGFTKKDGFEHLRDVITHHRRGWAEQHLERYVQGRWEVDIRGVGDAYHRHVADKRKPPTPQQFAKLAEHAANRWFGGDLAQLSNALGLSAPDAPKYHRLLPADRSAFVARVRELLGGQRWEELPDDMDSGERGRHVCRAQLANYAPAAAQIWEATGEPPPLKGTSWARHRIEQALGPDIESGWQTFLRAVEAALSDPSDRLVKASASPPAPAAPAQQYGTLPMSPMPGLPGPSGESQPRQPGVRSLLSRLRR